ncbi:RIPP2 protein, partial [Psilopogon haemacephalus]|nr:RIPP2 protein [Psilopogon haemacephalus]
SRRGRWAPRRAPPPIKPSGPAASRAKRRRMEGGGGGGMRCSCRRPPSAALPPQGCSPPSRRCGSRPAAALTVLPLPRRSATFWRPWVGQKALGADLLLSPLQPHSPGGLAEASRKLAQYTHPVRLFWPKSRCYDYLYQEAEALLKNFPVQATISFYEDSGSEDDDDELEADSRTESDC